MGAIYSVKATSLNLRSEPSEKTGTVLAELKLGQVVELLGASEPTWWHVQTSIDGLTVRGYAAQKYLDPLPTNVISQDRPLAPARQQAFDEQQNYDLQKFLQIHPPNATARTSDLLRINRSRLLMIDWDTLLENFDSAGVFYLKTYFEHSWKMGADYDQAIVKAFITESKTEPGIFLIKHGPSGRSYRIVPNDGATIIAADLDSKVAYADLWNKISSVALADTVSQMEMEVLDLSSTAILRQFSELDTLQTLADGMSKSADDLAANKTVLSAIDSEDEIARVTAVFLRMKAPAEQIQQAKLRLKAQAASLGYFLALTDDKYTYPTKPVESAEVKRGTLYQPYKETVHWTSHTKRQVVRRRSSGDWPFNHMETYLADVWDPIPQTTEVTRYKATITSVDPTFEKKQELSKLAFESYLFARLGNKYVTAAGELLEDIVLRCDQDEGFRKKCAIWIPIYEQKLTRGEILARYTIIKRPLPGINPMRTPQLFVQEELVYSSQWLYPELGELIHTINLAPGEERTVLVEKSSERKSEDHRSTTSIIDISQTESLDLGSEIENEARSSNESTSTSTWSVSAGATYGAASASGSAGGAIP
jgi:hypothetical protein